LTADHPCPGTAGYADSGSRSAVVSAFGFQLSVQLGAALEERVHAGIAQRALEIPLVNHDQRLLKHILHLVLVARSHRASVPRSGLWPAAWLHWRTAANGACDNDDMTKTELHELVDGLPDDTLNGAAVLLRSLTERKIDPDQAWFWTLDWLSGELEADREAQSEPGVVYQDAESFKAALHTARSE
jgi:hypothetical protein